MEAFVVLPIAIDVFWNSVVVVPAAVCITLVSQVPTLKQRPALRHALWLLVLGKLVTPSFVDVPVNWLWAESERRAVNTSVIARIDGPTGRFREKDLLKNPSPPSGQHEPTFKPGQAAITPLRVDLVSRSPSEGADSSDEILAGLLSGIALAISGFGSCMIVVIIASRGMQIGKHLREADLGSKHLQDEASRIASILGTARVPVVRVIDTGTTPFLWVSRRGAAIVFQRKLIAELNDEQTAGIIAHEIAHLIRRDHWSSYFASAVLSLFWWHPIAWLGRVQLRAAQEECCDALIISKGAVQRRLYAETLFAIVSSPIRTNDIVPVVLPGLGTASNLRRRFEMLRSKSVKHRLDLPSKLLLVVLASILPCLPVWSVETENATLANLPEGDRDAPNAAAVAFQRAIDSIERNYNTIESMQVSIEQLTVTPTVERREEKTGNSVSGDATFTYSVAPVFIHRQDIKLSGDNLRSELYERIGDEWKRVETLVRKGDNWTSNWAESKRTDQLGSFFPKDPRDLGGLDQRFGLLPQMRLSTAIDVSTNHNIVTLHAEIRDVPEYGYRPGQRFTYILDSNRNHLPTQIIRYHEDGSINVLTELEYEEVVPKSAWFVQSMSQKYFSEGVANKSDSNRWHQLIVHRVIGPYQTNAKLGDNVFEMGFSSRTSDGTDE